MKAKILALMHAHMPAEAWPFIERLRGERHPGQYRGIDYAGMRTDNSARPLHVGRFAEIYDRYWPLDPHVGDWTRYRTYNICKFGELCRDVPGDFVSIGVSFGVAARTVFEFVDLPRAGKMMHLVDPFNAMFDAAGAAPAAFYNSDPDFVLRQYPRGTAKIHRALIPDALPLPIDQIAFVFLDTGDHVSEAASIPILFQQLSVGGVLMVGRYGRGAGYFDVYDDAFRQIGVEPLWLPSGQAVAFKPFNGSRR